MGFKDFFQKKMIDRQLKNLPPQQKEMFEKLFQKNPEFMEKISNEIQLRKAKGQDEMLATISVMKENQAELQKLLQGLE